VLIDATAAGHGWFVDATPATDENSPRPPAGQRMAGWTC